MARESYRVLLKKSGRRWKVHSARVAKAGAHGRERPTEADRTGLGRVEVVAHDSDEVLSGHSLELDAYQEVFSPDGSVSLEPRRAAGSSILLAPSAAGWGSSDQRSSSSSSSVTNSPVVSVVHQSRRPSNVVNAA